MTADESAGRALPGESDDGEADDAHGFSVRDRRRFDADGRERPLQEEDSIGQTVERTSFHSQSAPSDVPIDFSTFILSLSTSAMIHLGDAPTPEGAVEKNLQLARQVIDMLGMLETKTRGNLTREEETLLEQLLYDLRLRYVNATA